MSVESEPMHSEAATPAWPGGLESRVSEALELALQLDDESGVDPLWSGAQARIREYTLRPGKRIRPALLAAGHALFAPAPDAIWQFGAGLELLHTFVLVHDDIADQADLRRGGPALHRVLGSGRAGEDLAVVAGDHLFATAVETMLTCGLPRATESTRFLLSICRHTAVGQYLDLELVRRPLAEVTLFQVLKVATLKTARYGFCAPLVAGAMLGGAGPAELELVDRVGRHVGLAYQLQDDLMGTFGKPMETGKPDDSDFAQGKRTFPVVAAFLRAPPEARAELETLWGGSDHSPEAFTRVRTLLELHGGRAAAERAAARATRSAQRALSLLPDSPTRRGLVALFARLQNRNH